jgi:hypothetical protein
MSTVVSVNTYTQAVTYVADKLLTSVKDIIRLSGLDPTKFASDWDWMHRGVRKWLETKDLTAVVLEVYDPKTDALVGRWDFEIVYGFTGDGAFRVDPDVIKYHILKQGVIPSSCKYRFLTTTKSGRPDVEGWAKTTFRSTDGFVKQSIGTAVDGSGLSGAAGYWRKATK